MCRHHDQSDAGLLSPSPPASLYMLIISRLSIIIILGSVVVYATPLHLLPSLSTSLSFLLLTFLAFLTILLYHTFTFPNHQLSSFPSPPPSFSSARADFRSLSSAMAARLAGALAIPTISHDNLEKIDSEHLLSLHRYLRLSFPLVHQHLHLHIINQYSLLYTMEGTDPNSLPLLFLAHLDVVPVPDADQWKHPPFSGKIVEGRIYGRGAIDDKNNICAQLEVAEYLLRRGEKLKRSIYFAFGHDEEVGGEHGAKSIASYLRSKGMKFEFSLDEGLFIINRIVPGYPRPVALVCTAEKGNVSVELSVELKASEAGHSSVPGKESAIAILSKALVRLHESVMPSYYNKEDRQMMEWLAHGFPFPLRVIVSNLWCFGSLLRYIMSSKPQTAATVRSTTALTVIKGGEKVNIVPSHASAIVNHRVHSHDSCKGVIEFDRAAVADPRVQLKALWSHEPSPVSSSSSHAFRMIHESIVNVFEGVAVAPALMVAGTDTRHYEGLCEQYFRFSATTLEKEEVSMFHGRNESISVENYWQTALFYYTLIMKCDEKGSRKMRTDTKEAKRVQERKEGGMDSDQT